ncbi:MAG TPA: sterol desaturase family protein [Labilithrix sp.]|jgi:sterol desaturase/sphingolipid hydroxylase (fatty acid hydroxylase superfamily)|nr:sterol desaturase family protein [Labilithrix sp.]
MSTILTLIAFWGLVAHVVASPERRARMRAKPFGEWALEGANLFVQGALIPLVLVVLLAKLWALLLPGLGGALRLPPLVAFLASFVGIDYVYYWNHRLLHTERLWPLHLVHHTVTEMDVFATSRNTVWTSFLIVYVWAGSFFVHLLVDSRFYMAGAAATAILDLWRHSALDLPRTPWIDKTVGAIFVLPRDHAWHHGAEAEPGNYGANFKLWDRIHGTYLGARPDVPALGVTTTLGLVRRLVWPFPAGPFSRH